jgi:hypothetical protein
MCLLLSAVVKTGIWVSFLVQRDVIASTLCIEKDIPNSCCKGSCVLEKELEGTDGKNPASGPNWNLTREIVFFFIAPEKLPLLEQNINSRFYHYSTKSVYSVFLSTPAHPPCA